MRILFQGDSITDSGRRTSGGCGYETDAVGPGYPGLLKSRILRDHPDRDDIEFVNRAISGNRIVDLYARWKADAINLAEDIRKYDGEDCDPQEIYEIMLEFAQQDAEDAQL